MKKLFIIFKTFLCCVFCARCNQEIPVIFVYTGYADYLKYTLAQAKKYNNRVVLISDDKRNTHNLDIEFHDISHYNQDITRILSNGTYTFLSHLGPAAQGWFILKNFLQQNNLRVCCHCDSDVMLYTNVSRDIKKFEPFDLVLTHDQNSTAHLAKFVCRQWAGATAFCTLSGIRHVCEFIEEFCSHQENWIKIYTDNPSGGCPPGEMLVLTAFVNSRDADTIIIKNICDVKDGTTYDNFILSDCNKIYKLNAILYNKKSYVIKKIKWLEGLPYCFHNQLNEYIRFKSLHLYVHYKEHLPLFYQISNPE